MRLRFFTIKNFCLKILFNFKDIADQEMPPKLLGDIFHSFFSHKKLQYQKTLWSLHMCERYLLQLLTWGKMHPLEQVEGTDAKKSDCNLKQKLEANTTEARNKSETAIFYLFYNMHIYECVLLFQYILSGHKGPLVAGQVLFCKIMISQKRQNWNKALVIQRTAFLCMQSEWKHNLFVYLFNANADKKSNKAVQL